MTTASLGEPVASSPLWLAYSGLPEWLNENVNRSAWLVFKTVVELDCAQNARPGTVETTPAALAQLCGLPPDATMRTLEGLRRKKCIALFLPEHPEELALIKVKTPLPTPRTAEEVREEFPFNRVPADVAFRYSAAAPSPSAADRSGARKAAERIVDLYFNTVGFKVNTFILDELTLLSQKFAVEEIEKAFSRAKKNDIRSLAWVARELYRQAGIHERRSRKTRQQERGPH